jgi:threonine/homoserine/homoserine lactone efflux protein
MAATFAMIECSVEFLLAKLAHSIRPLLNRAGNKFNRACGVLFALMGAALPMTN